MGKAVEANSFICSRYTYPERNSNLFFLHIHTSVTCVLFNTHFVMQPKYLRSTQTPTWLETPKYFAPKTRPKLRARMPTVASCADRDRGANGVSLFRFVPKEFNGLRNQQSKEFRDTARFQRQQDKWRNEGFLALVLPQIQTLPQLFKIHYLGRKPVNVASICPIYHSIPFPLINDLLTMQPILLTLSWLVPTLSMTL